jgi:hypothetical protein
MSQADTADSTAPTKKSPGQFPELSRRSLSAMLLAPLALAASVALPTAAAHATASSQPVESEFMRLYRAWQQAHATFEATESEDDAEWDRLGEMETAAFLAMVNHPVQQARALALKMKASEHREDMDASASHTVRDVLRWDIGRVAMIEGGWS